ncbi:MAG: alkaline phosphatase D [Pirellulaceae bacterium]|jgi:alkaline phosphatase D
MTRRIQILTSILTFTVVNITSCFVQAEQPLTKIAVGSCIRQDKPQPIWTAVNNYHPEVFVLTGDNIYGDSEDMKVLREKYDVLGSDPGFQKMRQQSRLLATWDDHDYGVNDGGFEYPKRKESQAEFNRFFRVPEDSPRRSREGVYDSVTIGPAGKRVQFILLDTRYFRTPLKRWPNPKQRPTPGPYAPNDDEKASVLGETQWKWFEEQLKQDAEVRIVVSSIQAVATENGWETWNNFPRERKRLFQLIARTKAIGVILVSGDRHLGEMSRISPDESGIAYPVIDFTSSSLNQPSNPKNKTEPNRYRVGENYLPVNFGTIEINWEGQTPRVKLSLRDIDGVAVLEQLAF